MATDVSVCNSALIKLGVDTIVSLEDETRAARLCKEQYPKIKRKLLRGHPWNFAIVRASISPLDETPAFEYEYAFQLPADALRVLDVNAGKYKWTFEGGKILTHLSTCEVLYIRNVEEHFFDAYFEEALASALAADLSGDLAPSRTAIQMAQAEQDLRLARSFDAQENHPTRLRTTTFTLARR